MGRTKSNHNLLGKAIPEAQEDREYEEDTTTDKAAGGDVFQEAIDLTNDLRHQLNGSAPDARIGLDKKRLEKGDNASGKPASPAVDPQLQAAFSAIIASLAQNPTVLSALMPRTGENTTPPPQPQPVAIKLGNDEGVVPQDTLSSHSHPASPLRAGPAPARGKASVFNRLGDTRRRPASERMAGRIGEHDLGSPRESLGSISRTADRPRLDEGKGKLHEGDACHQINTAHAARQQTQGATMAAKDPRDEVIAQLERRLAQMEAKQLAATPTGNPSRDPDFNALLHKVSILERELAEGRGCPIFQIRTRNPFTTRILSAPIPEKYRGYSRSDPKEHFSRYQNNMLMVNASDEYLCRWFLSTLEGPTYEWFNALPEGSIDSWQDLAQRFLTHFAGRKCVKKHFSHLLSIKQQHDESLRSFIDQWTKKTDEVEGADERTLLILFQGVLRSSPYARNLITDPPRSYTKALQRGSLYADADELHSRKKDGDQP
ncbi:unnamed protein product [Cuscuta europaea]|uniref:Retrotransposon gag domain-containing protein n=1 Tax=Cuscuta europaea TaxID=41803 RepID=A0A9P0ZFU4_CUSEU|nr:unnamed protein product [Cuscuta europaea]